MKVLVMGPSPSRSKGGMATVIQGIMEDEKLNESFDIEIYETYIDGNILKRLIFCIYSYVKFLFIYSKYDLFHIHMASYSSTFRKSFYIRKLIKNNKKVIAHIHGGAYLEFYNSLNAKKKNNIKQLLKSSTMVLALSDKWKRKFSEIFEIANFRVLKNGIDTEIYRNCISDISQTKDNFLFLGKIDHGKGIYDLLDAIKILKERKVKLKCYIAGDGEVEKLKKMVYEADLGAYAEVIGWVDLQGKLELLKSVSTVVLPSYKEGLPMTLLEGMAAGKAVISTYVGAIPELVIHDENGLLIQARDVESLADSMWRIINNPDKLKVYSKNNIEKISLSYSRSAINEELAAYYLECK